MASAGTVTVDFAAETARFTAELKKVQGSLQRLEGNFKTLEGIAGKALGFFSGAALAAFAKSAFSAADATATAAERAGIAVESFSRLQFAAGQVDVEMSALTSGIQKFQIALANADSGNKEAQRSLARFNLQAKDLANLSIEDQLATVAEAFKDITDPADRTRAAVELFGRSAGPQLVPFLAQGSKGIRALSDEADKLGITLKTSTAIGIDQADRALKRIIETAKGATADVIGRISLLLSPPKDEAGKLAVQIDALNRERQAILNARAAGDANAGTGFLGQKTLEEINAELAEMQPRLRAIRAETFQMTLLPLPWVGLQEIDLKPIQAMKIEIDAMAEAAAQLFANLESTVQAARDAQFAIVEQGAVDRMSEVQAQISSDLEDELQRRSEAAQFWREDELRREEEAQTAIQALKRATYSNGLAALQAFAGHSKKIAIAAIVVQKAMALKEAFIAGQVALAKAAASAPPPYNLAPIAIAKAFMVANLAAIAATGIGQIQSINSSGGAPIGSPANPVFTNDTESQQQFGATSQNAIQIIIANNVGFDQSVMDQIVAGIREAADDRDVILFGPNSRQAQDLVPA